MHYPHRPVRVRGVVTLFFITEKNNNNNYLNRFIFRDFSTGETKVSGRNTEACRVVQKQDPYSSAQYKNKSDENRH